MLKIAEMVVEVKLRKCGRVVGKASLTGDVLVALHSCGTSRQGTTPKGRHSAEALSELARLGLIGPNGGTTRDGSYGYLDICQAIEDAQGW